MTGSSSMGVSPMVTRAVVALSLTAGMASLPAAEAPATDVNVPAYEYIPFDGEGRFTCDKADGVKEYQGLMALPRRCGQKPYDRLWKGDQWQTERLCFTDICTGVPIVRLTDDYGSDYIDYHRGSWSADGKWIVWRRKPGMWEASTKTNGPTAVRSDGTGMKPVFRDVPGIVRKHQCSKSDPRLCYSMVGDTKLVAGDLEPGKKVQDRAEPGGSWHLKMSYDGKYLCSTANKGGVRTIWLVSTDGKEKYDVTVSAAIHDSYQPHPTLRKVIYWYEGKFHEEGFCQKDADNTNEQKINVKFDWNHGDFGPDRGVHETGRVFRYNGDKWAPPEELYNPKPGSEFYDDPPDFNGYTTWMPKDLPWAVQTHIVHRPYLSEFFLAGVEPVPGDVVNRFRLGYTNLLRGPCLDCADGSPDGTKVVYNSNMFGQSQVFYMVIRRPEPPRELAFAAGKLTWKPAVHAKETKGYRVYRASKSGGPYECLGYEPAGESTFADPKGAGGAAFYVVTAVEHSGLESGHSNEAASKPAAPQNIFVEAERAKLTAPLWLCIDARASDMYYIWQRKKDAAGKAVIPVTAPVAGSYTLWARVKGREAAKFSFEAAGTKAEVEGRSPEWTWVKGSQPVTLAAGAQELTATSSLYGSALDAVWLAADPAFAPSGRNAENSVPPPKVAALTAKAEGPFAVRLTWAPSPRGDVTHYNLYCSTEKNAPASRATLIASPEGGEYLDWKVPPNAELFYRITAVDSRWNESVPSDPAAVTTGGIKVVKLEQPVTPAGGEVTLDVPADGTYVLWLQASVQKAAGQYVGLAFDGGPARTWTCEVEGVHGVQQMSFSYGQFATWELKAGSRKLKIENKAGLALTKVILTNDCSFRPEGHCVTKCMW
ncbi:MAG: fibronectin type III domain-containing protein [Planctomycetota bacterium]|nr:fibronectin type III domain-containing protein [Planctomycetota bacterium]